MADVLDLAEKQLDRLKKLLALAASTVNEHESHVAAMRAAEFLERNPLPVRWVVPAGTPCEVFPMEALADVSRARAALRNLTAPKALTFSEEHRVKNQTASALTKTGRLYFQKHGFCILVRVKDLQVFF